MDCFCQGAQDAKMMHCRADADLLCAAAATFDAMMSAPLRRCAAARLIDTLLRHAYARR